MEIITKKNLEYLFLILILLAAAFLRFYKIRDYIVFLGDQGRDVLVVKKIIVDHKFTLLGPTTSVGGFYLGPFYYYLMVLPLWLAKLDPVGPAVMVASFGVATVFLVYLFIKKVFGEIEALLAATFYAFSPLTVNNSRFSWNPNTLPFFSLLYFYTLFLGNIKNKKWLFFLAGIWLGICFQLHYLAVILLPLGIVLNYNKDLKKWFYNCLFLLLGSIISFSPFILFEIRHGFGNTKAILEFVTRKGGAVILYPLSLIPSSIETSQRLLADFFGMGKNLFIIFVFYFSLVVLLMKLNSGVKNIRKATQILLVWWLGGALFLRLYQGTIYDYYFGYLYPLPAILLGLDLGFLLKKQSVIFKIISATFLVTMLFFSVTKQPILATPNRILEQTERISQTIIDHSQGKPFNFALISSGNSDHAYRYFLEIAGRKPTPLEEKVEEQLFVVCEEITCQPLGHPLWEVAAFGRAEITNEWTDKVGIKIFRLVHHQDSINWIGKPAPKGI